MTELAQAFLEAEGPRPDLEAAILARVRANDRRRRAVLAASAAVGLAAAAAALAVTGALDPPVLLALARVAADPVALAVVGLALTGATALREIFAEPG